MKSVDELNQRLARLQKWSERYDRLLDREARQIEAVFLHAVAEWETERKQKVEEISSQEISLKAQLDQAAKEYTQNKYRLERDTTGIKDTLKKLEEEFREIDKKYAAELNRVNEEKVATQISLEKQKAALTDLYQEKMRHLTVTRAGLLREWQNIQIKFEEAKGKAENEFKELSESGQKRLLQMQESAQAKRDGWSMALETIKKELTALAQEHDHLQKRLSEIQGEKEKELQAAQLSMRIAREQLDVDKVTLIEKAEEDQRAAEAEVTDLKAKLDVAERDLHGFAMKHEKSKKDTEEAFEREEQMLKEAVRVESEKRDYEQKLFEQEKAVKEKDLNRTRDEYEKKKWHWDNQIRSLMMQKAVHDSEYDAERMRVDREARTLLRSLEVKRDELKTRLADVKNRHAALNTNAEKEIQLIQQRWQWRKDRLWALWQNRLAILKKERGALQEQIDALQSKFSKENDQMKQSENRDTKRINDMEGFILQATEANRGQKKQKEIQFELEKTRVLAQIKELEVAISDWMERLKQVQSDVSKEATGVAAHVGYLDRWYREEEHETQLFLHTVQNAMSVLQAVYEQLDVRKAA